VSIIKYVVLCLTVVSNSCIISELGRLAERKTVLTYGIILAGGKGERFWPLSRANRPKQFLKLTSDKTMLEETILRVKPLIPLDRIRIVTGQSMKNLIVESVDFLNEDQILDEPQPRNTCLAIGLAAVHIYKEDPKGVLTVLSADHLIRPAEKLLQIIERGCEVAATEDKLITIGIMPTRAETGYGYIKLGEESPCCENSQVFEVAAFTEKPKAVIAQEYYHSRKFLWNSGMFIWSATAILDALRAHQPEMANLLADYSDKIGSDKEQQARIELYEKANSISIDYAVLECADNVLAIRADILWDDVGSWRALERYKDRDSDNNVVIGETVILDSFETTIYNNEDGIIALLGVSDLVVVRSDNITLVVHKSKLGEMKELLNKIGGDEKLKEYL